MKARAAAVLAVLALGALAGQTIKPSTFTSGGAFTSATDQFVVVRNANSERLVTIASGIINVQDRGVKPTNSAATNSTNIAIVIAAAAASTPKGATLYFPAGVYSFNASIDVSACPWISLTGDGWDAGSSYGSVLTGSISAPLVNCDYGSGSGTLFLSMLNIRNTSSNASAKAVYLANGNSSTIDRVQVCCPNVGIHDQGSFATTIRGCELNGSGNVGIGIVIDSGRGSVIECVDANGWSEAIRANGAGVSVLGAGFETNKIGLRLGVNAAGSSSLLTRSTFAGISGEANDYGIKCEAISNCTFSAIAMSGTVNAPSGNGIVGLSVTGASRSSFESCNFTGTYSSHGAVVTGNNYLEFLDCEMTDWSIAASLQQVNFPNSNVPGVGIGRPAIRATANITAQSGAATIVTYAMPTVDGDYEVSAQINVTAVTTLSTTLTCTYTDVGNTPRTMILPVCAQAGNFASGGLITATGTFQTPVVHVRAKANTNITGTVAAGTFTGVTYSASMVIKQTSE